MTYVLRLDWATMLFDRGTVDTDRIEKTLCGVDAKWKRLGRSENAPLSSPLGMRYMNDCGSPDRPHKLEVSGVGCQKFELTLPSLLGLGGHHFSRLDFAFDVLMDRSAWKGFLTDCFAASMNSDRQRKRYRLSGEGEAMTVYIGQRTSPKFFRIYNKTLQDRRYTLLDADGHPVDYDPEKQCVIRYEIELHRFKSVGKCDRVFDPSPAFEWYYSEDEAAARRLHDEVRSMWLSFGNEVLLPQGFADAEFVNKASCKREILCKSEEEKLEKVQAELHDFPHSFDHSMTYVAEHFGHYIPYILADDELRKKVFLECELRFGFVPEFYFECSKPQGWDDLQDVVDDTEIPWPLWEVGPDDQYVIDKNITEGGKNQWSL